MHGGQRDAAVAGREKRAGMRARLRVDRKPVRRHHAQRRPRAHRRARRAATGTRARRAPPSRPGRPDRPPRRSRASCCESPISTVPSSVWRIVSSGIGQEGPHALEHDDLALVGRDRRGEAHHRREPRVAEAGGEHDALARELLPFAVRSRSHRRAARSRRRRARRAARHRAAAAARRAARAAVAADCSRRRARSTCRRRPRGRCRAAASRNACAIEHLDRR